MKYIKGFDGIRALSILMVISAHSGLTELLPQTFFYTHRLGALISGRAGVDIFFCLSGFLITRILLIEKSKNNRINFKNFYVRRFLKLLPPLVIFYAVVFILMSLGLIYRTYTGLALSFFYLYNYAPNIYYTTELGHTWSLGVEEQYYLLWPLVITFFNRFKIVVVCIIIAVLCFTVPYFLNKLAFFYHDKLYLVREHFRVDRFFITAAYPIIMGCVASVCIFYYEAVVKAITGSIFFLLSASILFLLPLYCPFELLPAGSLLHTAGVVLILMWIFYRPYGAITKCLEFSPIAYIGKLSYSLYVYQGLFLRTGPAPGEIFIQQLPQNVIFSFLAAIISYEFVEKYFLRLKSRFRE